MLRRFILSAAFAAITLTFALAETNTYKVSKIAKSGDNYVLTVTQQGTFDKDSKKMEWKDVTKTVTVAGTLPVNSGFGGFGGGGKGGKGGVGGGGKGLEDGFANKMFETVPEGGFTISITTADADVKKGDVTRISVTGQQKKKKDAQ